MPPHDAAVSTRGQRRPRGERGRGYSTRAPLPLQATERQDGCRPAPLIAHLDGRNTPRR